jgi:oligosaccharide repeat unit polymerase
MSGFAVALTGFLVFLVLVLVNWSWSRSWFDPAVAISGVWMVTFLFLALTSDQFYGVTWVALGIYFSGLFSFSLGVLMGKSIPCRTRKPCLGQSGSDSIVLWFLFLVLLVGLAFYLGYVRQFSSAALFSPTFFLEIRQGTLMQSEELAFSPFINNLVVLSSIAAVLALVLTESGRRWRLLVAGIVALAVFYNLLTGAKAGVINLVVMLFAIYGIQRGQLPKIALILTGCLVVILFGFVTVQRARSVGGDMGSLGTIAQATFEQLGRYLAAGPVGFSEYLKDPQSVPAVWSPWRFFERTANYFGDYFDVPSLHAAYVQIGDGLYYNVYTAFFSYYPPYGLVGVVFFMLMLGIVAGAAFRRAQQQRPIWLVLYASIFYGVLMTIFAENLLHALNPIIKLLCVTAVVVVIRRFRFRRWSSATPIYEVRK